VSDAGQPGNQPKLKAVSSVVWDKHTANPMLGVELREPKLSSTQRQWDWVLQHSKHACTPSLDKPPHSAARHRARKQQQQPGAHLHTLAAPTAHLHLVAAKMGRGCCWGCDGGSLNNICSLSLKSSHVHMGGGANRNRLAKSPATGQDCKENEGG
jgi:hypothetical protein